MKNLKDLTPEECIKIATIVEPTVKWKFIRSKNEWAGFDLIDDNSDVDEICQHIFQIDYRSDEELRSKPRFRIYENMREYSVDIKEMEEINNYLSIL